jgi:glycosyltransferase involved in cell wall biosynthesis
MVSVVIPARHEQYLQQTVSSLLERAGGEIEIIVVLDGYWPDPILEDAPNVHLIHRSSQMGMRSAINTGMKLSKGKYVMKLDGHCLMDKDFDLKLAQDCQEKNWTLVPTAFQLSGRNWEPKPRHRRDFQYLDRATLKGHDWGDFENRVNGDKLCDLMTFQGSCWFMHREFFFEIGGEDEINYGWTGREAQEISLKTWLSGGRCVLDKNTWYAHYNKPKEEVVVSSSQKKKSVAYALDYWNNQWNGPRNLDWLYEKFAPVPVHVEREKEVKQESIKPTDGMARRHLYKLFAKNGFTKGVEVGVWDGTNAQNMMNIIPGLHLGLVDMFKRFKGSQHRQSRFDKARRRSHFKLDGKNVEWMEMSSEEAATKIPDKSLDFVYIDCNHSYDYAMQDIILWSRKVRSGGIVSGHDYVSSRDHGVGVLDAVNDYVRYHGLKLNVTSAQAEPARRAGALGIPSWYWEKP